MRTEVEVLADSISDHEVRLTTFRLRLPRAAVWEDLLTHRDWSRNASSSRATPVAVMLSRADWMPEVFGLNKKGMGADEPLEGNNAIEARQAWYRAMAACKVEAANLHRLGVAKEDANLLLRPFEWLDAVVTATRWNNFLWQRAREATGQVRRQVKEVAERIQDHLVSGSPTYVAPGGWHLPYLTGDEVLRVHLRGDPAFAREAAEASAMRCARVSISRLEDPTTVPSIEQDSDSCQSKLVANGHWSPLEHPARALGTQNSSIRASNVEGWVQLRKEFPGEYVE